MRASAARPSHLATVQRCWGTWSGKQTGVSLFEKVTISTRNRRLLTFGVVRRQIKAAGTWEPQCMEPQCTRPEEGWQTYAALLREASDPHNPCVPSCAY